MMAAGGWRMEGVRESGGGYNVMKSVEIIRSGHRNVTKRGRYGGDLKRRVHSTRKIYAAPVMTI